MARSGEIPKLQGKINKAPRLSGCGCTRMGPQGDSRSQSSEAWENGGPSTEREHCVSRAQGKDEVSLTYQVCGSRGTGLGGIRVGPRPELRREHGSGVRRRGESRGTHSRAAGRTALPRLSRLHLPPRPQVSPRRGAVMRHTSWRIRNQPRPSPARNHPGVPLPPRRRGGRDGSAAAETARALTRDSTPLRRAIRMRKAKRA